VRHGISGSLSGRDRQPFIQRLGIGRFGLPYDIGNLPVGYGVGLNVDLANAPVSVNAV